MKLILALVLAFGFTADAHAYLSASANDPSAGSYDTETKVAVKSALATFSDAIEKGHALFYSEDELTGLYKVSRYHSLASGETAAAAKFIACIAARNVATGDTAGFPCATRGYVDYAKYKAVETVEAIALGGYLCVGTTASAKGVLIPCAANVVSPIVALEAKTATGSGTIKVMINSK